MELNSRELATVILFFGFIALAVVLSKDRKALCRSLVGVWNAFRAWKVWSIFLVFILFAAGVIALAWVMGVWSPDLLKDTLIITLFTGIPVIVSSTRKKSGGDLIKTLLKDILGFSAFMIAYLNLASFPLWGEIILQLFVTILVLCSTLGARDPKYASVVKLCQTLLEVIGVFLFIYTSVHVVSEFKSYDWKFEASVFALSVWLPLTFLFVVYPLAYIAACESAVTRVRLSNKLVAPPLRVRFALIIGFRGSVRYAVRFSGMWIQKMSEQTRFREARKVMYDYRSAVRQAEYAKREQKCHIQEMTGVKGVDDNGLWLDRREFDDTKSALGSIVDFQTGYARNHKDSFHPSPEEFLQSWDLKNLPTPHGIKTILSTSLGEWVAYRQTIGGFYLGVGGRSTDISEQWCYANELPPTDFPRSGIHGWGRAFSDGESMEWMTNDSPLPDVMPPVE